MVNLLGDLIPATTTVELSRVSSTSGDGPTYGPAAAWSCRVELRSRRVQLDTGRVVTTAALIQMPAAADPRVGDRVVWTAGGREHRHTVEMVDTPVWIDGTPMHHDVTVS